MILILVTFIPFIYSLTLERMSKFYKSPFVRIVTDTVFPHNILQQGNIYPLFPKFRTLWYSAGQDFPLSVYSQGCHGIPSFIKTQETLITAQCNENFPSKSSFLDRRHEIIERLCFKEKQEGLDLRNIYAVILVHKVPLITKYCLTTHNMAKKPGKVGGRKGFLSATHAMIK